MRIKVHVHYLTVVKFEVQNVILATITCAGAAIG
jgi:hypothetical protein